MNARKYVHPELEEIVLHRVFAALSDPLRLEMVRKLAREDCEIDSRELAPDLPKSTLTHHTKFLREAGLTWTRSQGRNCLIRLRRSDIEELFPHLLANITSTDHP